VEAATSRQTSNGSNPLSDWDQGYGYQFWRCRHGAYRGDGAFGQYCTVIPEKDAVVAITSGLGDMQAVLNLVWDTLLPAMGENALPEAPDTREKLEDRAAGLVLRTPVGKETSPTLARIAGKRYVFPPNDRKLEAIAIERAEDRDGVLMLLRANGADQRLMCRQGRWTKSRISLGSGPERAVASSGAWTSDDTLEVKLCFYETPFTLTVKLRFEGDRVHREARMNVGFGPTEEAPLEGRSE
jgi:hypothetical protein